MKSLIKSLLESLYVGIAIEIFIGYIIRPLEEGIDDKEEVKTAPQTLVISKNDLDWNYLYWNDCYWNNLYWNYLYRKDLYWIHFKTPSNDKEEVSTAPQSLIISKMMAKTFLVCATTASQHQMHKIKTTIHYGLLFICKNVYICIECTCVHYTAKVFAWWLLNIRISDSWNLLLVFLIGLCSGRSNWSII